MTAQTRINRGRRFFTQTVPVLLRGIVVILLLTQQLWANTVYCGANNFEAWQSCYQSCEEHCSTLETSVEIKEHSSAVCTDTVVTPTCSLDDLWCCRRPQPAEPQPLLTTAKEQPLPAFGILFFTTEQSAPLKIATHSLPAYRSRPVFLFSSCFLI